MRQGSAAFEALDKASAKEPRRVVAISFDSDNTIVWYFTSHTDTAVPPGASVISGVLDSLSVISQRLDPDKAVASIGVISFGLIDAAGAVTDKLGEQLSIGRSTRRQRVQVYEGYAGLAWADYHLIQTQIVDDIRFENVSYGFGCADVQRAMRKDIFDLATTTLAVSCGENDAVIEVYDTSKFQMVAHGSSYSDAPNLTVGYFTLEDEIVRYTGKTATTFTGCTRGALTTLPAAHSVDANATPDRRTKVEEYVYLEMPAVKLEYAILTGVLHGQGGATLPPGWHMGVPTSFVRLSDFTGIGNDLWNPADDSIGFHLRFAGEEKTDGKQFIESQVNLILGCFMPIYNDGAAGLKRMSPLLAGAAYVRLLDEKNLVGWGELLHDFKSLHNIIQIDWNWEPSQGRTTRSTVLIDAASIATHGKSETLKLQSRGLHGNRHASTIIAQRFDAIRDRYTGPPLRFTVQALPSLNNLEVGDVARVRLANVKDFAARGSLDRSFEVQHISVDKITGNVSLDLFASSQAAGAQAPTGDVAVLPDAWYSSQGAALASVLTITGSNPGHVSASGVINGTANMNAAASIFFYNGDLVIDPGVIISTTQNVQLRIKGFLTNNGTITGAGAGQAGAAALGGTPTSVHNFNPGTPGFIGNTEAGGGMEWDSIGNNAVRSHRSDTLVGANFVVPSLILRFDGAALSGLPPDLRGTSGSSGKAFTLPNGNPSFNRHGGAGGNSGAGMVIISRGFSQGAAGFIDLSGSDGSVGGLSALGGGENYYAGSGAGGAPGALVIVADGSAAIVAGLTVNGFRANYGKTPIPAPPVSNPDRSETIGGGTFYSYYAGTGDGSTFPVPSLSGSRGGNRVQYVPANVTANPDPSAAVLAPPTSVTLASGGAELLLNGDGTVVPRIHLDWNASSDPRVLAYEIQFKLASSAVWQTAPLAIGGITEAWLSPVTDGVAYDVRVRAAGAARQTSIWVTVAGHVVQGKASPPQNVTGFQASQNGVVVVFQWTQVGDVDLAGYEIRYGPRLTATWADGIRVTETTRGTQVTSAVVPPGDWKLMIKARDTSSNESVAAASVNLVVENELDVIYQRQQAPDWVGAAVNFHKHWTGKLVPESTVLASAMTDAQLWDTFVHSPQAICTYEAPEIDIGFDDTSRIWASIDSALGPGVITGIADPDLEIDWRLAAGAYDGFEPWSIGDRMGRFFKHKLVLTTAEGIALITGFLPTVDQLERTETGQRVIAAGGTSITYDKPFHVAPLPQVTVIGAAGLFAVVSNPTTAGCTINVYNTSNVSVGGTIAYDATGV